jgi:hypothetical protein
MENEPPGLPRRPWGPGSPGGPGGPGGPGRLATGARPVVRGKVSLEVIRKSYTIKSLKQEPIFTSRSYKPSGRIHSYKPNILTLCGFHSLYSNTRLSLVSLLSFLSPFSPGTYRDKDNEQSKGKYVQYVDPGVSLDI